MPEQKKKPTTLYDPMPKEDLKLPPLVRRPYEQSSGSLVKEVQQTGRTLVGALANIHIQTPDA